MGAELTGISVLTLVRNREGHLRELVEGLNRSARRPDELIVIDMSDRPSVSLHASFPVIVDRLDTDALPLARARNAAATRARHETLVFLDVDCIPMRECIGRLGDVVDDSDALACADVRYLGPEDARCGWEEADLLSIGRSHPVRSFPAQGVRRETNPGLFWSLAFAMRRATFRTMRGFDERFEGYGAEDTDFGFRAAGMRIPLLFVGGAVACHQHHETFDPPLQHFADIVRNARRFHEIWGRWPMEGWLSAFHDRGLVEWRENQLRVIRTPDDREVEEAREKPATDAAGRHRIE